MARKHSGRARILLSVALGLASVVFVIATASAVESRLLTRAKGLPSDWVTALAASPDGKLWVGTGDAGVFLLDPRTGDAQRIPDGGLPSDPVYSIATFRGKVYVGTSGGLSVYDGTSWSRIPQVGNVTMRNVRLAASPDGRELWACSVNLAGGTVRFDGAEWKFMGGEGRGLFNDVQGFAFLSEGVLMASGSGIPYLHKGTDVLSLSEGLPPASLFSAGSREGRPILGTSGGLFEYEGGRWQKVPLPAGFAGKPVFVIAVSGGTVVIGGLEGIVKLENSGEKSLLPGAILPPSRVTSIAIVEGTIAAGTAKGLVLLRDW